MQQLNTIEEAVAIIEQYGRGGQALTNNYMLQDELVSHIEKGRLYAVHEDENAALLLRKRGFYRMYYYLKALDSSFHLSTSEPVVQEILYRGGKKFPEQEVAYWKKNRFQQHLGRDCYFVKSDALDDSLTSMSLQKGIEIEPLQTESHLIETQGLIEDYLDLYTGDTLSLNELKEFADRNELFGVFAEGQLAGVLQAEFKNKTFWLGHMVVKEEYRGRKLSTLLLKHYFQEGLKLNCRQFQLWVINDNLPALSLYKKYGFQYLNKSTISLLKTNER